VQVAQQAGRWSLCFLLWMPLDDFRCPVAGLGQLPTIGLADSTHFAPDILWLVFESGYFGGGPQSAKITAGARQRCACGSSQPDLHGTRFATRIVCYAASNSAGAQSLSEQIRNWEGATYRQSKADEKNLRDGMMARRVGRIFGTPYAGFLCIMRAAIDPGTDHHCRSRASRVSAFVWQGSQLD
jgi:hypothetical protein